MSFVYVGKIFQVPAEELGQLTQRTMKALVKGVRNGDTLESIAKRESSLDRLHLSYRQGITQTLAEEAMGSWFQRGRTRLAAWIKKNILRPIKLVRKHPQKIEAANGRAVSFPPVIRQTAIGGRIGGQAIVENCTTSALTTSLRSLRPDDGWSPKQVIRQLNRLLLDVQNGRVTEQELHSIARAGWDLDTSQRILEHLRANRISSKDGKAMLIPGDLGIALSRPGMSLFLARQGIPNRWLGLRNRSEVQETLQHLHAGKPVILGDTRRRHVVTLLGHPDKHQEIWCMDSLLGTWAKYDPSQLNFSQHEGAIMALLAG